jgi:hypothetical protein
MAVILTTLAKLASVRIYGAIGVLYWLHIKIGGLVITCITRGTSTILSNTAWRIPFGLFLIILLIMIALVWFTPKLP